MNMKSISFYRDEVYLGNPEIQTPYSDAKKCTVPGKIEGVIQYSDLFVVLIRKDKGDVDAYENVYAYDYDGNLVWRISSQNEYDSRLSSSFYPAIRPDNKTDNFYANDFDSWCLVNSATGNIVDRFQTK